MHEILRKLGKFHEEFLHDCHESLGFNANAEFDFDPGSNQTEHEPNLDLNRNEIDIGEVITDPDKSTPGQVSPVSESLIPSRKLKCSSSNTQPLNEQHKLNEGHDHTEY